KRNHQQAGEKPVKEPKQGRKPEHINEKKCLKGIFGVGRKRVAFSRFFSDLNQVFYGRIKLNDITSLGWSRLIFDRVEKTISGGLERVLNRLAHGYSLRSDE